MKKLLIIDGNAILHRGYHAYPPLTNPKGEMINAVFGFFSMLLTVLADQKPDYFVVCFDRGKPTFRMNMYAGYHAHRPKMADDFFPQVGIVHELLEKMKVQIFELDGYEADDLIGTIAKEAVDTFHEDVVIVTGDRDLLQLVNGHVKILMPVNGFSKTVLFDEKAVEEKYGVHPKQFVDYKALIGDASDGYPGVTGIGPKGAAKLLQEHGTFEKLYNDIGLLPEKIGLKLATDAEQAALAKKLAKIVTDSPIQFDITKCNVKDFDIKALREEFSKQDFKSLLTRLDTVFGKETDQLELL
ncbi:MAG TPA: 5'-3' exonuclease H3TH domain-containing protein [Candidatus Acidoferrales bacterium]|nr:5'-3' exonuclease H3TH domain-containing protein [Candidatus Acidoferrales bacterium]